MNETLARALTNAGDLQLHTDYGGRGMGDRTTHAVSGEFGEFLSALGYLTQELVDEALTIRADDTELEDFEQRVQDLHLGNLGGIRADDMGRQSVFY